MNPHVYELLSQKRLSIMGVQGGNAPLKILLNSKIIIPLPRLRGYAYLHSMGAGGGERAPVALCREPTDAAAETRGWVPQSILNPQVRPGGTTNRAPPPSLTPKAGARFGRWAREDLA